MQGQNFRDVRIEAHCWMATQKARFRPVRCRVCLNCFVEVAGTQTIQMADRALGLASMSLMVLAMRLHIAVYSSRAGALGNYLVACSRLASPDSIAERLERQSCWDRRRNCWPPSFVDRRPARCLSNCCPNRPFPVAVRKTRHGAINLKDKADEDRARKLCWCWWCNLPNMFPEFWFFAFFERFSLIFAIFYRSMAESLAQKKDATAPSPKRNV